MRTSTRLLIATRIAVGLLLIPMTAAAQDDKTGFTVLDPTPSTQMRAMSTDRPNITDGPFTVDAGHTQFEFDGWNKTQDTVDGFGTTQTSYGALNVRIGVTNDAEVQVMLNPVRDSVTRNARGSLMSQNRGLANITTRVKLNLIGNDDGDIAFALLPYVTVPTRAEAAGTRAVTGGLSLPLAIKLDDAFSLGLMTKLDLGRNNADTAYAPSFVNGAVLGFAITDSLSTYAEVVASHSTIAGAQWQVTADTGLTFALTKSIQFDAGVNVGVTRAAPDLNPFVGISWRF